MRFTKLVTTLGLLGPSAAILVSDNSPCGSECGNVLDATTADDIVCSESSYNSGTGALFAQCLTCEQTSTYSTSDNDTDAESLLYNLRYAVAYCLFGVPAHDDVINTPCLTSKACEPYQDAILYKNLSTSVDGYDYCDDWPKSSNNELEPCITCLQAGDENYIANFFTVLEAGCEQKPAPGVTISIEGSIFSDDVVNITSPTPTASVNPDWFDHGPVSLGGKVGIAVGGVAFILFLLGFWIVWNGKRRRRAFLRKLQNRAPNSWPAPLNTSHPDMHQNQTPMSQRPLRGWDDSPMSVQSEQFPKYISPFPSQYSSPVSATELKLAHWPAMVPHTQDQMLQPGMISHSHNQMFQPGMIPHTQDQMFQPGQESPHIGVAYGGDQSSINTNNSDQIKGKQESYEMQPVEGGQQGAGVYGYSTSHHPSEQQGYFEGQFHPGQMFPNMYQQEQQEYPGHQGYEGDVKR